MMSKLTEELKEEHIALMETLNRAKEIGVTSEEGYKTLQAAKTALLAHLKKEDSQLYPVLRMAAEKDAALKRTLDMFARDMEGITDMVMTFFDKYSGVPGVELARDFGKIYSVLSQRIIREEGIIYPKYDELNRK